MDEAAVARDALGRFITTYGGSPPPVDVVELAESLCCLRVRAAEDLAAITGAPAGAVLSGMLLGARREVWVSDREPPARRRFSIAHEIGHFLLHATNSPEPVFCRVADLRPEPDSPERKREREANGFAAELLMPEDLIAEAVKAHGPDPFELAGRFKVSDVAMGWRLVNLGYMQALPVDLDREWREWRANEGRLQ